MCFHKSLTASAPELEAAPEPMLPDGDRFQPVYHANAYQFPAWPILTSQQPGTLQLIPWGLIPHWTKNHPTGRPERTAVPDSGDGFLRMAHDRKQEVSVLHPYGRSDWPRLTTRS